MRFEDYTYTRPNLEEVSAKFEGAIQKFKNAVSPARAAQYMQFDDSFRMMQRYEAQQPKTNNEFQASVAGGIPVLKN